MHIVPWHCWFSHLTWEKASSYVLSFLGNRWSSQMNAENGHFLTSNAIVFSCMCVFN